MKDKNKIAIIVLAVVCVISIVSVVYLYTVNSSLKSENAAMQSEQENAQSPLEELQEKITELETNIETLETVKANIKVEQAASEAAATDESDSTGNTTIASESTDNDAESTTTGDENVADESNGDESGADESGVTVNSTHDNVKLGDDEYKGDSEFDGAYDSLSDADKAIVDQIVQDVVAEYPELFEDNGDNRADNYLEVDGVVDTGEFTGPSDFEDRIKNDDGSEAAGAIVY